MKHKLPAIFLALVLLTALAMPAFADLMWEPYDNSFYERHRDECSYENRSYLVNGQKGYVTLRSAPDSVIEVVNVPNGASLYIGFTWQENGGETWAVGDYAVQEEGQTWKWYTGWVSMDDLALIYDDIAFEEDHGAEFQEYDGSGDELTEAYLYSYPNGSRQELLVEAKEYMPFSETFQQLYTDDNGLRWTYVGYYMGRRNAWVCIDDPLNEDLGVDTPRTVGQVRGTEDLVPPAGEVLERIPAAKTWIVWLVPAVLVVIVVVVTAVLVRRKNKKA